MRVMGFAASAALMASYANAVDGTVTVTNDMAAIATWLTKIPTIGTNNDHWTQFLLSLQEDTQNNTSQCIEGYNDFYTLLSETITLTADQTDYQAGLSTKGNGSSTTAGFVMYQVQKWADVGTQFSDFWVGCNIEAYLTSVDKAVTSFSGAVDFIITFFWRYFSEEDGELYTELTQALYDEDYLTAGARAGTFFKEMLKTLIPDEAVDNTYTEVDYISA